jgi:hypothetical protein
MKVATMHNDKQTAPASTSAPPPRSELSEADFLDREVAEAKSELQSAVAGLTSGLASSADLRAWVKRYPWAATGTAVAAGFAAGTAITSSPRQTLDEQLPRRTTNGQPDAAEMSPCASTAAKRSVVSDKLMTSLFDLAKFALQSVIVATLRPPAPQQDGETAVADPWPTKMAK